MTRWLAIDYGTKRIGLAISEPAGAICSPIEGCAATGQPARDVVPVIQAANDYDATGFVIGLPINMDGSIGPQAKRTTRFVDALRAADRRPVETCDERLSTFQANEWLRQAQARGRRRDTRRDSLAAVAILQSFLAKGDRAADVGGFSGPHDQPAEEDAGTSDAAD